MDFLPPGRVVPIGDHRWRRFVIRDSLDRFWAGEGRWTDDASKALLFGREIDAAKTRNRHCLGDPTDTFTANIVIAAHAGRWSRKALAAFLNRHREFFIGGPKGKEGLLLEIVPDTLRKTKP